MLYGRFLFPFVERKPSHSALIKAGDVLLEVDLAAILKEGYSLVTPILVTNSDEYLDVLPNETEGMIAKSEVLLTVIK